MISWSHPTPLCLMPSMHACVLPIPTHAQITRSPMPHATPPHAHHACTCSLLARMSSAHALPHAHTQQARVLSPTPSTHVRPPPSPMPSAHALLPPTPAQPLFPGHKVLTCFPGCLGPTSGGCSPAASHRQTWHSGRHSAESPESSSVNPKQKVIGLPWE